MSYAENFTQSTKIFSRLKWNVKTYFCEKSEKKKKKKIKLG